MKKILCSLNVIALLLAGCGGNEFQGVQNSEQSLESFVFEREVSSTNVDMVWVIDNSASMSEEIQLVRENLGQFLLSLEERARLNFTLITHNKGSHGMALSDWALSRGYRQIPQRIESYDGLTRFLELIPQMLGTSLRLNSKKVIVVVSDDNSEISANSFAKTMAKIVNLSQLKLFGFVGLSRTLSPCIDRVGSHYINLAQATGGQTFNICESNWAPYFESLVKDVGQMAKTEFTLPFTPKGKVIVKVDDVETKSFSLKGRTLIIHPDSFPLNKKYKIEVLH